MDLRRFRQWSPPTVSGEKVSPGTIISKARKKKADPKPKKESEFQWDPRRDQFRHKDVLEKEGYGSSRETKAGDALARIRARAAGKKESPKEEKKAEEKPKEEEKK